MLNLGIQTPELSLYPVLRPEHMGMRNEQSRRKYNLGHIIGTRLCRIVNATKRHLDPIL